MAKRATARQWRRAVSRHRRLLAAVLAAAAMTAALTALRPAADPTVDVPVAAKDLAAGARLHAADLDVRALPAAAVPAAARTDTAQLVGQVLAGPIRKGESFTDVRLVGASSVAGYGKGTVGTPVRIADPGVAALLHPGSVIDVLAVPTAGGLEATGPAKVVASKVRVLAVPETSNTDSGNGTLIVVAATQTQAKQLTRNAADTRLSITLHGR
ncbi:MAG: Flp pilus assembly protein CpaB [Streptosporangiales bacterium]|nr:Flp pilus assembly protein CpaB [Streptosporangiales bacterium]